MDEPRWVRLIAVNLRSHADLVESYLKANGIETQLIQEAYYQYRLGYAMGPTEILVPNYLLDPARKLYESTGWDFDATEIDEEDDDEQSP